MRPTAPLYSMKSALPPANKQMGLASGCDVDRCRLCSARRSTARREGRRTAVGTIQGIPGTLLTRGLSGIDLDQQTAMILTCRCSLAGTGL